MNDDMTLGMEENLGFVSVGHLVRFATDKSGRLSGIRQTYLKTKGICDFAPHPRLPLHYLLRPVQKEQLQLCVVAVDKTGGLHKTGKGVRVSASDPERGVIAVSSSGKRLVVADSHDAFFVLLRSDGRLAETQPHGATYIAEDSIQGLNSHPRLHIAPKEEFVAIAFLGSRTDTTKGGLSVLDRQGHTLYNSRFAPENLSYYFDGGFNNVQITSDSRFLLAIMY